MDKLAQRTMIKPKSDEYSKVKPIIPEIFFDHYNLAIKYISEIDVNEGEYYLLEHSKDWFEIMYFSTDQKKRNSIVIDFRDDIQMLWFMFIAGDGFKRRAGARKNGKAIPVEDFKQFLNLTLQYVYDSASLIINLSDYLINFRKLCHGDTKIQGFIISAEKTLEAILNQLQARKEYLEKRLIENDSDSVNDRLKLRGELEGIQYAIKVTKSTI